MTDASLLSRPVDATASPAAGRTEPFPRAGEPVVTVVADVTRPSKTSASRARPGMALLRSTLASAVRPASGLAVPLGGGDCVHRDRAGSVRHLGRCAAACRARRIAARLPVSLRRVAIGFSIGALGGLLFGLAVGLFAPLHDLFDRSLQMIRTIPHLALAPLMILWFGIGEEPRLILVAMGSLFPVYINTIGGIRNVDPKLIELGKSYGLGRAELVWSIILPAALQPILVGMRMRSAWPGSRSSWVKPSRRGTGLAISCRTHVSCCAPTSSCWPSFFTPSQAGCPISSRV
ncbi:ABC transporter permease [Bradyrhizobium lupini]|uniref:ABC transporter permease n=1 Tax=Rhizobium lupini TaxID=136996 RepID=UPI00366EEB2B